jgi:hypothetical protein
MTRRAGLTPLAAILLTLTLLTHAPAATPDDLAQDRTIADSLAAMLQAGRTVVSANQDRINDPSLGPKGLDGKTVLADAIARYQTATHTDPTKIDPTSRQGTLMRAMMDSIVAVMDTAQPDINAKGVGFKGFIPAVFGRLVSEEFDRRANGAATIKVTAPLDRVRNRTARPDAFETQVIEQKFLTPAWPRGTPYAETVQQGDGHAFRVMVPEYYGASCLACHGTPKGSTDITGYPREGFAAGDLGGVISITLLH